MNRLPAVAVVATAALIAAIYALRLDHAVGLIVDDAWYVVLAKALSEGRGFRLISSAAAAIVPAVPPGFPALLAPIFWLASFPGNLFWLKLVSVLAMFATGIVCWIDFTRHRGLAPAPALMLATATVITPAFVFLATSTVMAECVFTLAQLMTVILVERAARDASQSDGRAAAAGLAGAAAMLIRLVGIAVVSAAIAYLLINRRWRQAAVLGATVVLCMVPWQLYARANQPTLEERMANGGTIAYSYQQLVAMRRPGDTRAGEASPIERVARAGRNAANVMARDVGAVLIPAFYRGPSESGQELLSVVGGASQTGSMGRGAGVVLVSLLASTVIVVGVGRARRDWLSMPALVIVFSIALIVAVGSQTFRYLIPLTPYLLLFFWRGLGSGAAARIAVLCLLGFNVMDHAFYIHQKLTDAPPWVAEAAEIEEVLGWMANNVKEPGAVASNNPGLVYLRTGRQAVANGANRDLWRSLGVRYVVALQNAEPPEPSLAPRVLYRTANGRRWVVQIFSSPDGGVDKN